MQLMVGLGGLGPGGLDNPKQERDPNHQPKPTSNH